MGKTRHDQRTPLQRKVRLDTLLRLRWLAIIGQTSALLIVQFGLEYDFPIWEGLAIVALSAVANLVLRLRFGVTRRVSPENAAWLLAGDIMVLALLLYLTGGQQNPFSFLLIGPVLIAAPALPPRLTLALAAFAMACSTALTFFHLPLPWDGGVPVELPALYVMGVWMATLLAIAYTSIYAWQITEESRKLVDALAATEMVLAREQHLSQLDGLAAAAAHELGTPLSTIAVIARELERTIGGDSPHGDDVRLLREQALRCREILGKLTALPVTGEPFGRMRLSELIEEVVAPHRHFGIAIEVNLSSDRAGEPVGARNLSILYGLGNILENAVDFARERVVVTAVWDERDVAVTVVDDGPGFPPEIMERVGEPYVRSSRRRRMRAAGDETGLGLGFFIAKTLLERTGATLELENRAFPERGAVVRVHWSREQFEAADSPPGEAPMNET
ncbi:MAG: ActS/PrrB/RegB family redox-sensitive histidine kinase [Proteobacteria bacterium]|nr:ActS/PrrB/RegB family redox-sensitive histidine kinase [Pseudomonadota bacterium]